MKRRIVPGGILALGLAVVLLAATASTASADTDLDLWCAPLPTTSTTFEQIDPGCYESAGRREVFDFGDRKVETTSPAQGFALGVTVNDTFNPRISVSGDYTQTNSCHVLGCPDYDAKLVLGGDVKKTTKQLPATNQLAAYERTTTKARLKHLTQLRKEPTAPKIKIKFTATDEFGQRVTEERKVELCSRLIHVDRETLICRWHPSRK